MEQNASNRPVIKPQAGAAARLAEGAAQRPGTLRIRAGSAAGEAASACVAEAGSTSSGVTQRAPGGVRLNLRAAGGRVERVAAATQAGGTAGDSPAPVVTTISQTLQAPYSEQDTKPETATQTDTHSPEQGWVGAFRSIIQMIRKPETGA